MCNGLSFGSPVERVHDSGVSPVKSAAWRTRDTTPEKQRAGLSPGEGRAEGRDQITGGF